MRWDERWLESAVSSTLRTGVSISVSLIALGTALSFGKSPSSWLEPGGVAALEAQPSSAAGLISLGILLLIATPVVRVVLSFVFFLSQRDRLFAALTGVVLVLLGVSFLLGAASV